MNYTDIISKAKFALLTNDFTTISLAKNLSSNSNYCTLLLDNSIDATTESVLVHLIINKTDSIYSDSITSFNMTSNI